MDTCKGMLIFETIITITGQGLTAMKQSHTIRAGQDY